MKHRALRLLLLGLFVASCNESALTPDNTYGFLPLTKSSDAQSTQNVDNGMMSEPNTSVPGIFYTLSNGITLQQIDTLYYLEGDMVYDSASLSLLSNAIVDTSSNVQVGRSAYIFTRSNPVTYYWTRRRVPYSFDSSFSSDYITNALAAMETIEAHSGVRFVAASTSDINQIIFHRHPSENSSRVGMIGGTQHINICDNVEGIIIHEILHALGFYHEHTRLDRDNYIIVNEDNIIETKRNNFVKHSTGMDFGPFDFESIMLYSSTVPSSWLINPSIPAMTKNDGSSFYGQRFSLSSGDIVALRNIYGPPYHELTTERTLINEYCINEEDYFEEEVKTYINFYADEARTIPAALPSARAISLRKAITTWGGNGRYDTQYENGIVIVPSGTTRILISSDINYELDLYGTPHDMYLTNFTINNSHF